jgi:hypothetical protein
MIDDKNEGRTVIAAISEFRGRSVANSSVSAIYKELSRRFLVPAEGFTLGMQSYHFTDA